MTISLATIKRAERGALIDLTSARALAELLRTDVGQLTPEQPAPGWRLQSPTGPARPVAIAVMPFEPMEIATQASVAAEYFCDGLVDDLLCRLGSWWFPVISRSSTLQYRGRHVAPVAAATELGARYVVTGTVRRAHSRVRISVELLNAETQSVVWTGQLNGTGQDILELQEEMSAVLFRHLGGRILNDAATNAVAPSDIHDADAWETSLRGAWHYYRDTVSDNALARQYLSEALRRQPQLRCAHYWLCMTYQQELVHQWSRAPQETLQKLTECVGAFRRWHPSDPYMHTAAAYACIYAGQRHAAHAALEEAIGAEPNITPARSLYGQVLAMGNQPEEAVTQLQMALALSPLDPRSHAFKVGLALAHFVAGRYEATVEWCQLALADARALGLAHAALASARAHLGDLSGAKKALAAMQEHASPASEQALSLLMAATESEIRERFLNGLYLAGLSRR